MAPVFARLFVAAALLVAVLPAIFAKQCKSVNHRDQFYYAKLGKCVFYNGPSPARSPPSNSGKFCPANWAWSATIASGIAGGCVPTQPWVINKTPRCTGKNQVWSWSKWVCTKSTVPGPQPTHHYKRKEAMVPRTCPVSYTACAVTSEGILSGYECLDTDVELESCGGCASIGEGQDCTAIPGAWNIGCNQGKCEVFSCAAGYILSKGACVQA